MEKQKRGFALMSPEKRSAAGKKGGKKVQAMGTGHRFTPEEASAAGKVGGLISKRRPRCPACDPHGTRCRKNRDHKPPCEAPDGAEFHPFYLPTSVSVSRERADVADEQE